MSRKYKFYNKEGMYFVSFATIFWIDVFIREEYFQIMIDRCYRISYRARTLEV